MESFESFFTPDRVAIIGATERAGSVGRSILENLQSTYAGTVVPINPRRDTVFGLPCRPNVACTDDVDLAIIVLPPEAVLDALDDAVAAGIQDVVVISAGFAEAGSEGARREHRLVETAHEHGIRLVGPNSLGIMSTASGLNATFSPVFPTSGSVSLLSQSGAFITAFLAWAADHDVGIRHVVSLGNEAVLDQTDFIEAWGTDPGTELIIGYLEGIDDGRTFIETCRTVTRETPVVLTKSGRSEAGARAASSHTGAIAGNERVADAGLQQAGVVRVNTIEAMLDATQVVSMLPTPAADDIAIVTNAGGPGVLATDAISESGLSLTSFEENTRQALENVLPPAATASNPVDVLGDADAARIGTAVEIGMRADEVSGMLVVAAPTAVLDFSELAGVIGPVREGAPTPIIASFMGGAETRTAADVLESHAIPQYFDPARAVRGMDLLARVRQQRERNDAPPDAFDLDLDRVHSILANVSDRPSNQLGVEAMDVLSACGIDIPPSQIVDSRATAVDAVKDIGEPAVMKLVSPDISHKSDIGGVELGVTVDDAASVYESLLERARSYHPNAGILGVQVQAELDLSDRTETIVGIVNDPQFGPTVLFGLGGIFVEVFEDTAVRVAPISRAEASEMVADIRGQPLLVGARGRPPADVDALIEAIQRLSALACAVPAILELDINPLVVGPDGVVAIDIRLIVEEGGL